jgi:hypothetical protein
MKTLALSASLFVLVAAAAAAADILVTSGSFTGSKTLAGKASIVEAKGQRMVRFSWTKKPSATLQFRLVKQESLKVGPFPAQAEFVDLGSSPSSKPISKDLDVWLYRSVAAFDPKTSSIVAFANLRSAQEKGR